MAHKLFVCLTCLAEGEDAPKGPALLADLQARFADAPDLEVVGQDCLSACATPQAIAFRAEGKAAYLFAGVDAEADRGNIAAFAEMYRESSDGWIEDARPAGRLRFCLVGRMPA